MAEESLQSSGFDSQHLYVWVKSLETKVNGIVRELSVLKSDLSKKTKNMDAEVTLLNEDVLEVKRNQDAALQKMDIIINELKRTAGKEEVLALKKYIDLWNPMHFATQQDVERLVNMKLKR